MQYSYLRELFLVPKGKKIVCSFWGSDLLRTNDILNFYFVKKALNRAAVITCQSEELKEIVLSKFGRNLADKIQIALFPVYEKIYDSMDLNYNNQETIDLFKSKFNFSKDKINILIGHSGSIANNHLKIINALQNSKNIDKIHLVINLNYAITAKEKEAYKLELIDALKKLDCSYVILEKFFVNGELAISRLASDIFIHAPISDALSGTMLELLYASNIVITGSWLPYKTYRKAKLDYFEIYNFLELSEKLDVIIDNFDNEKEMMLKNKQSIRDYFISESVAKNWSQILS
jgi:glycosyltransferase involved in cell wall biosynthesis